MFYVVRIHTRADGIVYEVRCTDGRTVRRTQQEGLAKDVAYCANAGNVTIRHIPGYGAVRVRH